MYTPLALCTDAGCCAGGGGVGGGAAAADEPAGAEEAASPLEAADSIARSPQLLGRLTPRDALPSKASDVSRTDDEDAPLFVWLLLLLRTLRGVPCPLATLAAAAAAPPAVPGDRAVLGASGSGAAAPAVPGDRFVLFGAVAGAAACGTRGEAPRAVTGAGAATAAAAAAAPDDDDDDDDDDDSGGCRLRSDA